PAEHSVLQAIEVENVAVAVTVHHHVHSGGLTKIAVYVESEETRACVMPDFWCCLLNLLLHRVIGMRAADLGENSTTSVTEGHNEEAAAATSRIQHSLSWLRINHLDHHANYVAGREELALLLLKGVRCDGLEGHALCIRVGD